MSEPKKVETSKHHRLSVPEALKLVNVKVGFGIGDLKLSGSEQAGTLFQGDYENPKPLLFHVLEEEGQIIVGEWSPENWFPYFWYFFGDCYIELNKHIPSRIAVAGRLGDTNLNLSEMKLKDLRIRYLVGDLDIQFPVAESMFGSIESSLGDITLAVPRDQGARIRLGSTILGTHYVEGDLFERHGADYVSKSFDKAENRLDLRVDCHLGDLRIRST